MPGSCSTGIEGGWRDVADATLDFVKRFVMPSRDRVTQMSIPFDGGLSGSVRYDD
jgi:hypothetical protein